MPSLNAMARNIEKSKKPAASEKPTRKAPAPVSVLSTEFVQESDEEGSYSKKSSDSDDESFPANPAKELPKVNGKAAPPVVSSSSESGSESPESGSEEEEDEEPEDTTKRKPTVLEPAKRATKEPAVKPVSFREAAPYKPPSGFNPASLNGTPKASQLFKRLNLEGKQIWYFTAPASVPISAIEKMSIQGAKEGKTILSYKGGDYGFVQDVAEDKTYTKVMIPSSSDDGYRTGGESIGQILHLQRVVKLPTVHKDSMDAANLVNTKATIPAKKPVRQQPDGLKMRFRPIGFGRGRTGNIGSISPEGSTTESDSDEEMPDAPAYRRPVSVESSDASSETSENEPSSSKSDEEMTDVAGPPPNPTVKEVAKPAKTPLKRKRGEGADKESKKSSSISTITPDDKQLKRLKTKQTGSQKNMADRQSASAKPHKSITSTTPGSSGPQVNSSESLPPIRILPSSSPVPVPRSSSSHAIPKELPPLSRTFKTVLPPVSSPVPPHKVTPIPPPKSHLPPPQFPQSSRKLDDAESPIKSELKIRDRSPKRTSAQDERNALSLQELTRATDPSLTGEERRKEIRRLKKESKKKRREPKQIETAVDIPMTTQLPLPPTKSQSRSHNQNHSSPAYVRTSSGATYAVKEKEEKKKRSAAADIME